MNIKVVVDSGSGLSQKQAQELGMDYLPLQVTVGNKTYMDGVDLTIAQLYEFIEQEVPVQTSQPALGYIEDLLDSYTENGITDILLITLSSGLSGTNATMQAACQRHNIQVHTLDIFTTLAVEMYCAKAAQDLVEQGLAVDEIIRRIQASVEDSKGYLIAEDLNYLSKGGRLTPMAAKLGGLLKIKPILEVSKDTEGKVDVFDKVRTTNKAIKKAVFTIADQIEHCEEYNFFVLDSNAKTSSLIALEDMKVTLGEGIDVQSQSICSVIASHTGLGAIGIQYIRKIEGVRV